ncbi:MAG: 3-methylaspartate ammonia-lyase, partial [Syntrophobacteraceae bacterium]
MGKDGFKVLSPTAILGYGFPEISFRNGLAKDPDLIAVDAGSTDPGPYYLGAGKSFTSRLAVKRDLALMLNAALERSIPLIVGSAGGAGARPHVEWLLAIMKEVAQEERFPFRAAAVYADISR